MLRINKIGDHYLIILGGTTSSRPLSLPIKVSEVLNPKANIMHLVNSILTMKRNQASHILGKTTRTAFRRVHEVLASILDHALASLETPGELSRIQLNLSRSLVLVKYQESRDQLSRELASILTSLISGLSNELAGEAPLEHKREVIERCRTFLDSLLVLVYSHKKR